MAFIIFFEVLSRNSPNVECSRAGPLATKKQRGCVPASAATICSASSSSPCLSRFGGHFLELGLEINAETSSVVCAVEMLFEGENIISEGIL